MRKNLIGAVAAFALLLTGGVVACGTSSSTPSTAEKPVAVQQVPSARDIAKQLGGTSFTQKNVGDARIMWGMTDGGTFWIGGTKYAVNTFTTQTARDRWLKVSMEYGVNPKWKTSTSVIYQSLLKGR